VRHKRWVVLLAVVGFVIAAAFTTAAFSKHGSAHAAESDDSPLLAPSTTLRPPPTRATTTTFDVRSLPRPQPPPADPYAPSPIIQIGAIEIPKIQLLHPIFEGITLTVIDHGPGHWPGSAMPCQRGNSVFPGHRVTHTHPFLNIDQLSPGDKIIFHMPTEVCVYKVTGTQIVDPNALWVTDPTAQPTVTLIACHPKHSAAQRIVVKGVLVSRTPVKS